MALALRLEDAFVAGGAPSAELVLDRRGAILGRSPTVDWTLPDPERVVSSRHCEIDFRGGGYLLVDTSTNGTFVNDQALTAPHLLADGDVVSLGRYRILVALDAPASAPPPPGAAAPWGGWGSHGPAEATPATAEPSGWDRAAPAAEISGRGALSGQWAAPRVEAAAGDGWGTVPVSAPPEPARWGAWSEPVAAAEPASGWSSAPTAPAPAAGDDIWGKIAASHVVDWARGGFGAPDPGPPPTPEALALATPPAAFAPPAAGWAPAPAPASPEAQPVAAPAAAAPGWAAPVPAPVASPAVATPMPAAGSQWDAFAAAAGVPRAELPDDAALATATGGLLRRLVAGMVVMLEARARAKSQMGAQSTSLQFDGNNPLKFARSAEGALKQLLRTPERGFMPAERAVEDAFVDLQAHQIATLKAMQGALRATLDRFSPAAIRQRAEGKGLLARILPTARNAALWEAYEREFSGVARGSDEAFMDVFAKEFRRAYEEAARGG